MAIPSSPSEDHFSTPPSTPSAFLPVHPIPKVAVESMTSAPTKPSLLHKSSRPHSLTLDENTAEWAGDVVLQQSPDARSPDKPSGQSGDTSSASPALVVPSKINQSPLAPGSGNPQHHHHHHHHNPHSLKSPCFVHSHLDKGASLADWLRQNHQMGPSLGGNHTPPNGKGNATPSALGIQTPSGEITSSPSEDEDDEDFVGSLTRQLAETAVGVREMSKQLGRARVRSNIQNVLVITKARDNRLIKLTRELALYLMKKPREGGRGLVVYVDAQLRNSKRFDAAGIERDHPELFIPSPRRRSSSSNSVASMMSDTNGRYDRPSMRGREDSYGSHTREEGQLRYWTSDMCIRSPHLFDIVVTLGGDGTVLFTSWLFQRIVPPVIPFALGSLGFLTNFDFNDHQAVMDSAIENGIRVNLRMRFTCTVYRAVAPEEGKGRKAVKNSETGEIMMKNIEKGGWEALEGGAWAGAGTEKHSGQGKDKEIMCFTTRPVESFEVLNDLVVDRGPSPYVSLLELFGDEHHMTTVQADGLTVSTPTGSTAYSLSAGGSLVHPEIPAILITPICPHTLSFRPMLLPDSMELRICVPFNSRSTAWASFDGRGRVELKQGDHIKVTASKYPFPTVCADKQSTDWFHAISRTLKWNERERQKSFVVVEEGPAKHKKQRKEHSGEAGVKKSADLDIAVEEDEIDEEDEEEEEEKFDIDDSSPEANNASSSSAPVSTPPSPPPPRKGRAKDPHVYSLHGTDSPDRFANGAVPQPKLPTQQHFIEDERRKQGEDGDRDDIHSPRSLLHAAKSKIPKDRDVDGESMRTPRPHESVHPKQGTERLLPHVHRHRRNVSEDSGLRRAFAVWGHDESDSNTSDSEL